MDAKFANVLNSIIAQNQASSAEMEKRMSGQIVTQAYKDQMIKAKQEMENSPGEFKAHKKLTTPKNMV